MKFSKRILSLVLSALMLMSMFTMVIGISASADETNDAEIASIQNSLLETISTDTWSSRWNDTSHIDATGFKGGNELYTFAQYKGFVDLADIDWTLQFTYNQPKATNINSYLSIGDLTLKFSYTVSGDVRGEIKYTMTSGSDSSYKPLSSTRVYATGDSGDFLTADVFNASTIKIERVGDTLRFYRNGEIMVFENGVSEFDATKFNFNANANSKQIYIYSWAPATSGYWVKDITLVQSFPYKTVDALNAYLAGVEYVDNTSVESVKEAVAIRDMVDAAVEAGTVSSATYGMIDFSALETAIVAMENDKVTQFDVIAGEGGTVDAVVSQDFYVGDTYTIKAAANTGYVFKEWQNADGEQIATSAEYTVTLAKTNTFTAVFAEDCDTDYSIVSCDDSLGTVAGDGFTIGDELRVGNSYTVVATPAEACVFTEWTVDGNAVAETASYTFTYVKGIQIVANFRMVELTAVTVNTEGVGTVTIQGTSYRDKYAVGDEVTLVASFNYKDGYIFDHWEKDGQSIGTETSLVQTVVEGLTVKAVFTNDIGKLADYEIAHFEYPLLNAISKTEWNDRSGSSSNIVDGVGLKGTGGGAGWYMYTGSINLSTADFTYTFTYNCPNINNTDLHSANIGSLSFKFNTSDNKFYISGGSSNYNPLSSSGSYIYASGNSGSYVTKAEFYTSKITIVRTGDTFRFYRNDELMVFANGMSEFDATKYNFNANANSSQLRFQLWCPNTYDIVVKDISLVKLLGCANMDEFNASLASVDSADSAAIAESHEVVDYLKNNTLYVKEKIDESKLVHDYDEYGICKICGAASQTAPLRVSAASITLQSNIQANYKVNKNLFETAGYSAPYMTFTLNGKTTRVDECVPEGDYYVFRFSDIAPDKMNDTITSVLYATKGDAVEQIQNEYSIATYCYNLLEKSTDSDSALRTLLVDMLNYGAASQTYTGYNTANLVNAALSAEQKGWETSAAPTLTDSLNTAAKTVENATATWIGAALRLTDRVEMKFILDTASIDGLTVKFTNAAGNVEYATVASGTFERRAAGGYYVYFDGFDASQMSEVVYVTAYKDGVAVSNTIAYSVETYACAKQNSSVPNLGALVIAMMKYGNAAKAYASV